MSFLRNVIQKIDEIPESSVKERYLRAIARSLEYDEDHCVDMITPEDISSEFGVTLGVLLDYKICIDKHIAVNFLDSIGKQISYPKLRASLSSHYYFQKFNRLVSGIGNRHIFTYGEIMVFFDHCEELDVNNYLQ